MKKIQPILRFCFVFILGICVSCGSNDVSPSPRCITGTSALCACAGGRPGAQVCRADGTFGACSCDTADSGPALDAALDAPPADREPPPPDAVPDTATDTPMDVAPDAPLDATDDAPFDTPTDSTVDSASDAIADVARDLPTDLAIDTAADVARDAAPDVAPDVAADIAIDSIADVASDAPPLECFLGACNVTALPGSQFERCALITTGDLYCWGGNYLGNGMGPGSPTAIRLPSVREVTQVDPGDGLRCLMQRAMPGRVYCWGEGVTGTGNSPTNPVNTPALVMGITDAVSIAVGPTHACAIRPGGEVACWGEGSLGATGNGLSTGDVPRPATIAGLSEVVTLWSGSQRSCVRRWNGEVLCWGKNSAGVLGDGTTTNRLTPTRIPALDGMVDLSMAAGFSCARFADGSVRCWGVNNYGQLGIGRIDDGPYLVPTVVPGVSGAVQLSAGGRTACVRMASGRVLCWGSNVVGEIGDGTRINRPNPTPVMNLSDAVLISVSHTDTLTPSAGANTCALRQNGRVVCWGGGADGQLGNGLRMASSVPVEVVGLPPP